MQTLVYLWKVVVHPRTTSRDLLQQEKISRSGTVVLLLGVIVSLLFLISHLKQDYPPPADELQVWIETWGEFAMLPFLQIPAEKYRLAQAIFFLPLVLAIWILMAGSARLLSILFGGKVSYKQYLNLFGFSFFAFWILGHFLDITYSALLGDAVLRALRMEYGPFVRGIVANFPSVMWTVALTIGGIYNAIVTHESEGFSPAKAAVVGAATFFWPIVLISFLIR
jgi:hypothetical protein